MIKQLEDKIVRTRIAPSPTGFPHIGTIYQALFNFAFARKNKGKFIVRIEDTDRKRFVEGAEEVIYNSLDWFNLIEDESPRKDGPFKPYKQSERLSIYNKYAQELLKTDHAYYCFCSKERLGSLREKLQKEKNPIIYDKHCFYLSKEEVKEKLESKTSYVVRLNVPKDKKIVVKDEIRGDIEFDSNLIDDQVLIKSDGFPTYHLAVVVDDHLMEITDVIRGEEWLSSTPKHILLYDFLNFQKPLFYHTPDLRNPDKSKLSKRHGHTNVNWYKEQGFLPEAILNFLALMGWSHPEQKEIFSLQEFIELFNPKDLKPAGPIFDLEKLKWMNGIYIRQAKLDELKSKIKDQSFDFAQDKISKIEEVDDNLLTGLIVLAQTRIQTLNEFYDLAKPFFEDIDINLNDNEKEITKKLADQLLTMEHWNSEEILNVIKKVLEEEKIRMPVIYKILTGSEKGLPLPQALEIFGKEKTMKRLRGL